MTDPQPGAARALRGTAHLVTGYWPRLTAAGPAPTDHDAELLAEVADVLDPGGRLALVLRIPAPTEPLTIHTGPLLTAVLDAGLGQLVAVHAVAIAPRRAEDGRARPGLPLRPRLPPPGTPRSPAPRLGLSRCGVLRWMTNS